MIQSLRINFQKSTDNFIVFYVCCPRHPNYWDSFQTKYIMQLHLCTHRHPCTHAHTQLQVSITSLGKLPRHDVQRECFALSAFILTLTQAAHSAALRKQLLTEPGWGGRDKGSELPGLKPPHSAPQHPATSLARAAWRSSHQEMTSVVARSRASGCEHLLS